MNEPKGNELTQLTPFYEKAADILLKIQPQYLIFFEPQQLVTSSLVESKLPQQSYNNAIFAPHFYNPFSYVGLYDFSVQTRIAFKRLNSKSKELQVPQFMGEFGCKIMEFTQNYIDDFYEQMDEYFVGGTQWTFSPTWNNVTFDGWNGENFSIVDNQGNLREGYVLRPSVRAIPGTPVSFSFQKNSFIPFQFTWKQSASLANIPLIIYLPMKQLKYQKEQLQFSKGLKCEFGGYQHLYLNCICDQNCSGQKFVKIDTFAQFGGE
eukprot:TRINITY_DN785_c6_g1_i4.p1 TRINITY_DN785_c6_g1~~TRINITY_DN785_c6_g1_i4.p1  ORF type:complete len:264 (-),score=24.71 TRINITY_DN785_c6_g1_i4:270-1061(-)